MALNDHDQARMRDYLLGHLSAEEQEKIEERGSAKGELIEEYRAGELSRNDHEWFEEHYLASKEGRRAHAAAAALNSLSRPIPPPRKLTWFERLQDFFKAHRLVMAAATSAAVVIIVAAIFIFRPRPST